MNLDLLVVVFYFLVIGAVGWMGIRRANSKEAYLVAGRNLGPGLYLGTLSAVVLGGASTIGSVKLGYTYGISGVWLCGALGLGIVVLSFGAGQAAAQAEAVYRQPGAVAALSPGRAGHQRRDHAGV